MQCDDVSKFIIWFFFICFILFFFFLFKPPTLTSASNKTNVTTSFALVGSAVSGCHPRAATRRPGGRMLP
jgi:hypothetical protein